MIKVTLKGSEVREFEQGITAAEAAKQISGGLYRAACAARIDGELKDLRTPLTKDCSLQILTFDDPEGKHAFWHTSSHMLARAVKRLYPAAKLAIGPAIDNGFYYDFDVEKPFGPEELARLEAEMKKIAKEAIPLERYEIDLASAMKKAEAQGEPYKLELMQKHAAEGAALSYYRQGDFEDLCAGPHLMDTSPVRAVKLTQSTGAYWHGDASGPMLCRVYGITFPKASLLDEYLARVEEAKKRDHRKLGKELGLFTVMDEGPGFPFFLPKGMILKNLLIDYWRQIHTRAGYQEISTPIMLNRDLWERSGHWENFRENMYLTEMDDTPFALKPMNCPGAMLWYLNNHWSYKDLPLRSAELGIVHRYERSGALHGLMRVRAFTQDDAHIFMLPSQIEDEIGGVIDLVDRIYKVFDLEYRVELSTKPEKAMGSDEQWEIATSALERVLAKKGIQYKLNPGDGAFYGPKIDFHVLDSLKRSWQCATIQLDFQMPERFDLTYTGEDGQKHRPVMVHRVIYGAIDRFFGILIEHYAGAFPVWLAPVQVKILPIADRHHDYAQSLGNRLEKAGIRVDVDLRNEKIGYKIRQAQSEKVPYMLVVGDKEVEAGKAALRTREKGDLGSVDVAVFQERVLQEIQSRQNS